MKSDEIAIGILKAAMVLAVGYVTYRFFSDYPLLLIPVAVVGIVISMAKDVGIARTALWLVTMGAFVSFGWGIYSAVNDGQSTYSNIAIGYGLVVMIVGSAIDDWLKKRALTASARVS